jgi:alpha-N-arabinofuranosidase
MGLLEFLEWCEDLKMEPVMAVYGAFSIEEHAAPEISPYVQDALDEIEYAAGGTTTKWGAQRAKDGHRAPFPIHYIEVGNEDNWNQGALTYNERFAAFYDAIKAKYPGMEIIATTRVTSRRPDFQDDHAYFNSSDEAERAATRYDKADRNGPKILFGEYATQTGGIPNLGRPETSNLDNALGDAAFLTGLERNSDIVLMASYAPLFINMNPGAAQWRTDLIGYDALHVFGSVSYYAQKMFSHNLGDEVLAGEIEGLSGSTITLFYSATRDSKTERIYLKVVNTAAVPQPLRVDIRGVDSVAPTGCLTMLTSAKPTDMNSLAEPTKVVPIATKVSGLGPSFTRTLPPYSISIFQLQAN